MLHVMTLLGMTNPQPSKGTTVIIRDAFNNPVVIIIESAEHVVSIYSYHDIPEFEKIAKQLGIDRLAICDTLVVPEPQQFQGMRRVQ